VLELTRRELMELVIMLVNIVEGGSILVSDIPTNNALVHAERKLVESELNMLEAKSSSATTQPIQP
jgi:hypothetical protein